MEVAATAPSETAGDHLTQPLVATRPRRRRRPSVLVRCSLSVTMFPCPVSSARPSASRDAGSYPAKTNTPKVSPSGGAYVSSRPVHGVAEHGAAQGPCRLHRFQNGIEAHPDGSWASTCSAMLSAQDSVAPAHEHGHGTGVPGEEHGFLGGGEPAAHHKDIPVREEPAVARGAVGHAPPRNVSSPSKPTLRGWARWRAVRRSTGKPPGSYARCGNPRPRRSLALRPAGTPRRNAGPDGAWFR